MAALLVGAALLFASPAIATSVTPVGQVSLSSKAGGVQHVRYELSFTTSAPGGGLAAASSDTITIAAPAGTVLKNNAQVHDDTTNQGISVSGALSNADATLPLDLCFSEEIHAGDQVTIVLDDVKNTATGGPYVLNLST